MRRIPNSVQVKPSAVTGQDVTIGEHAQIQRVRPDRRRRLFDAAQTAWQSRWCDVVGGMWWDECNVVIDAWYRLGELTARPGDYLKEPVIRSSGPQGSPPTSSTPCAP
jgi:hypothetical protein